MGRDILLKGTGAANSEEFEVKNIPVMVTAYPVANMAAETLAIKQKMPDGTFEAMFKDGSAATLSATNPTEIITGTGTYRLDAAARTSAFGAAKQESPAAK